MSHIIVLFWIGLTLAVYAAVRALYLKYTHPLLNVVVLSAALLITVLLASGLSYETYAPAKEAISFLLGPATVGLAVPLYRYRRILREQALAIVGSVAFGAFLAMFSAALIVQWGGLPKEVVMSILPKGVSIPFAVEIAAIYNGIPPLAVAFVVATGTLGSLVGVWTLNVFGITDPLTRGLALGTVSHAQGTAVALAEGEQQGAMAGLAMILAGICTAAFAPFVVRLLILMG